MQLKKKYIDLVSDTPTLQGMIAESAGVEVGTVLLWIRRKYHKKFLNYAVLETIKVHTGVKELNDLVDDKVVA